jgi:hypothetical protein
MALSAVWVAVLGWAALMEGCGAISCTNYDEFQVRHAQEGAEGSVVAQFPPLPYYWLGGARPFIHAYIHRYIDDVVGLKMRGLQGLKGAKPQDGAEHRGGGGEGRGGAGTVSVVAANAHPVRGRGRGGYCVRSGCQRTHDTALHRHGAGHGTDQQHPTRQAVSVDSTGAHTSSTRARWRNSPVERGRRNQGPGAMLLPCLRALHCRPARPAFVLCRS